LVAARAALLAAVPEPEGPCLAGLRLAATSSTGTATADKTSPPTRPIRHSEANLRRTSSAVTRPRFQTTCITRCSNGPRRDSFGPITCPSIRYKLYHYMLQH